MTNTIVLNKKKCKQVDNRWVIMINGNECGHAVAVYKTPTQRKWDLHLKVPMICGNVHEQSFVKHKTINQAIQEAQVKLAEIPVAVNQPPLSPS